MMSLGNLVRYIDKGTPSSSVGVLRHSAMLFTPSWSQLRQAPQTFALVAVTSIGHAGLLPRLGGCTAGPGEPASRFETTGRGDLDGADEANQYPAGGIGQARVSATASRVECTPSLARMFCRCVRTVLGIRFSRPAI